MNKVDDKGLIFANLNDFDAKYGHYFDTQGWSDALEKFDRDLDKIKSLMKEDDLLIICSDGHGCDPVYTGLHTREYSPLICYHKNIEFGKYLGDEKKLCDIAATIVDSLPLVYRIWLNRKNPSFYYLR